MLEYKVSYPLNANKDRLTVIDNNSGVHAKQNIPSLLTLLKIFSCQSAVTHSNSYVLLLRTYSPPSGSLA